MLMHWKPSATLVLSNRKKLFIKTEVHCIRILSNAVNSNMVKKYLHRGVHYASRAVNWQMSATCGDLDLDIRNKNLVT